MNNLQMLKKAMLAYVSAVKFVWSAIAYPLSIVGKKLMNLRGYRVYGNSVQDGTPTPETPIEIQSVGDLSTKNLLDIDTFNTTAETSLIKYNKTTGIITHNYGIYGNYLGFHSNIKILKAGTYTMSCEVLYDPVSSPYSSVIYMQVSGYDENGTRKTYYKTVSVSDVTTWTKKTVTLNVDTDIDMSDDSSRITGISIQLVGNSQKYNRLNLQIRNVMIAEGNVNDDYEPYHKYKIPVVARGKNLLPTPTFSTFTRNGVTFTNNKDGSITINGTPTAFTSIPNMYLPDSTLEILRNNVCVLTGFHNYEKNISFALSIGLNGNWIKYIYLNPYTYKNYVKVDLTNVEFDTVVFTVRSQNVGVLIDNLTVKPLLEVGTTMPTSFEPYIALVTTNIFLNEPLRKVGDYADYVDFEKQKVVRNVDIKIYDGSEDIKNYTSLTNSFENHLDYPAIVTRSSWGSGYTRWANEHNIAFDKTYYNVSTPDEFKAKLAEWYAEGKPLCVQYVIKSPTEETVKLPALSQFKGTTIYEVGTNIKPSGMEAKYC